MIIPCTTLISNSSPENKSLFLSRGFCCMMVFSTGLGLHIVSKYTELMNGTVECKSELEKGTEFIVTFNIKKSEYEKDIADRRQ